MDALTAHVPIRQFSMSGNATQRETSSTTTCLKLLFRFVNQIDVLRALAFREPRDAANWRSARYMARIFM